MRTRNFWFTIAHVPRSKAGWRRFGVAGLCVLAVAVTLGSFGSARAAPALLVDDDGAECPTALYATISAAIAAANAGDTIVVCPGTYDATTVDKRVTLSGYTSDLSKRNKCADRLHFPADITTKDSIVAGLTVAADFVVIKGFTLTAPEAGILIPGAYSDATVTRNVFQDSSIGVNLNGTESLVDHNCFRENNAGGSASGTGIYSDQGLRSTTIDANVFLNNTAAAITLLDFPGPGTLDHIDIKNNVSTNDGDLISIAGSTNSQIKDNTSSGSDGAGIFVEAGAGPNSTLRILNNTLVNGDDIGINVDDGALENSTIKGNKAKGNSLLGILVQDNNAANSIVNNDFRGNLNNSGTVDCADLTSGGGTAGTANIWKNDKGKTAFPPAICKKK
jgi:parallel beta-helix repeat protein